MSSSDISPAALSWGPPRGVAQSGSAFGWGPKGRWFKSSRPDLPGAPRSGAAHSQRRAELREHVLLALADALGVETHESALLGGVGGALRALHDPRAEGLSLL